jgi:hypothetical protein
MPRPWLVTPHTPLEQHDDNLWSLESPVPGLPAWRRMIVAKDHSGGLIFYNAVPVDEPTLAAVLALGKPKALVIPHARHGIDAPAFSTKLGVPIHGPHRNEAAMRARFGPVRQLGELEDAALRFEELDGTKSGEPVMVVRSGPRVSLVFADAYQDHSTHIGPLLARLMGFRGGPSTPPFFRLFFTSDLKALRSHLARLAQLPGLHRVLPSHGPVREGADAIEQLRHVARG